MSSGQLFILTHSLFVAEVIDDIVNRILMTSPKVQVQRRAFPVAFSNPAEILPDVESKTVMPVLQQVPPSEEHIRVFLQ
jgi:hypothetical protein